MILEVFTIFGPPKTSGRLTEHIRVGCRLGMWTETDKVDVMKAVEGPVKRVAFRDHTDEGSSLLREALLGTDHVLGLHEDGLDNLARSPHSLTIGLFDKVFRFDDYIDGEREHLFLLFLLVS